MLGLTYEPLFPYFVNTENAFRVVAGDFVSTEDVPDNVKDKKAYFIENIYKKKLYRQLTIREAARVQGFPDTYKFPENYGKSLGLLGNALGVNIVREVANELLKTIK